MLGPATCWWQPQKGSCWCTAATAWPGQQLQRGAQWPSPLPHWLGQQGSLSASHPQVSCRGMSLQIDNICSVHAGAPGWFAHVSNMQPQCPASSKLLAVPEVSLHVHSQFCKGFVQSVMCAKQPLHTHSHYNPEETVCQSCLAPLDRQLPVHTHSLNAEHGVCVAGACRCPQCQLPGHRDVLLHCRHAAGAGSRL